MALTSFRSTLLHLRKGDQEFYPCTKDVDRTYSKRLWQDEAACCHLGSCCWGSTFRPHKTWSSSPLVPEVPSRRKSLWLCESQLRLCSCKSFALTHWSWAPWRNTDNMEIVKIIWLYIANYFLSAFSAKVVAEQKTEDLGSPQVLQPLGKSEIENTRRITENICQSFVIQRIKDSNRPLQLHCIAIELPWILKFFSSKIIHGILWQKFRGSLFGIRTKNLQLLTGKGSLLHMTTTLDTPCKINIFGGSEILKDIGTLALVAKWRFWA